MNEISKFLNDVKNNIAQAGSDQKLKDDTLAWMVHADGKHKYSYNFTWLGRPVIQFPQDIVAMQELIWTIQPDLIIETGVAHGGSIIFSASMLELNAICGGPQNAEVLGIDIDIRPHNLAQIEAHPLFKRVSLIQGSSIDSSIVENIRKRASNKQRVLVMLDSNHTHEHVLAELEAYAPLVSIGSYCVVFDTIIEDVPGHYHAAKPWSKGNNPKTAVRSYLEKLSREPTKATDGNVLAFEIDKTIENKLLITVAPDGYLRRVATPPSHPHTP